MPTSRHTIDLSSQSRIELPDSGLVFLAGPPFSGKTTTAHRFLSELNRGRRYHVATLEDPVEKIINNRKSKIDHYQVGRDIDSLPEAFRVFRKDDIDLLYLNCFKKSPAMLMPHVLEMAAGNCLVIWEAEACGHNDLFGALLAHDSEDRGSDHYFLADVLEGIIFHDLSLSGRKMLKPEHLFCPADKAFKNLIRKKQWQNLAIK